jgi:hypothetical protein
VPLFTPIVRAGAASSAPLFHLPGMGVGAGAGAAFSSAVMAPPATLPTTSAPASSAVAKPLAKIKVLVLQRLSRVSAAVTWDRSRTKAVVRLVVRLVEAFAEFEKSTCARGLSVCVCECLCVGWHCCRLRVVA